MKLFSRYPYSSSISFSVVEHVFMRQIFTHFEKHPNQKVMEHIGNTSGTHLYIKNRRNLPYVTLALYKNCCNFLIHHYQDRTQSSLLLFSENIRVFFTRMNSSLLNLFNWWKLFSNGSDLVHKCEFFLMLHFKFQSVIK